MATDHDRKLKLHRFAASVVMACDVRGFAPSEISQVLGLVFDYAVASDSQAKGAAEPEVTEKMLNEFLDATIRQRLMRTGVLESQKTSNVIKASGAAEFLASIPVSELGFKQ